MKKQQALFILVTVVIAAVILVTASSFSSPPQAKGYEYATIIQSGVSWLSIAKSAEPLTEEKLNLPKSESTSINTRPLLNKVIEFEKEGWEIVGITHYATGSTMVVHMADMRRPIP